jgi:hypothetical protein
MPIPTLAVRRDGLEDLVGKPPVDDPDERHGRGGKISPSRRAPYAALADGAAPPH